VGKPLTAPTLWASLGWLVVRIFDNHCGKDSGMSFWPSTWTCLKSGQSGSGWCALKTSLMTHLDVHDAATSCLKLRDERTRAAQDVSSQSDP
jgi:hypothetical protein